MDRTESLRLERSIEVARRVLLLSAEQRTRALTYLAGATPSAVTQAIDYVEGK